MKIFFCKVTLLLINLYLHLLLIPYAEGIIFICCCFPVLFYSFSHTPVLWYNPAICFLNIFITATLQSLLNNWYLSHIMRWFLLPGLWGVCWILLNAGRGRWEVVHLVFWEQGDDLVLVRAEWIQGWFSHHKIPAFGFPAFPEERFSASSIWKPQAFLLLSFTLPSLFSTLCLES